MRTAQLKGFSAGSSWFATGSRLRRLQVIRSQIKQRTYDVDTRLAAILDRVFEDLKCEDDRGGATESVQDRRVVSHDLRDCLKRITKIEQLIQNLRWTHHGY